MAYPMGEAKLEPLRIDFDRRVKLEFHGRGRRPRTLNIFGLPWAPPPASVKRRLAEVTARMSVFGGRVVVA